MSVIGIAGYLIGQGIIKPRSVSSGIEHIQKEIDEWEMPHSDQDIEFQQQHFIGQGNLQNAVMFIGDSNMAQYAARINLLVSRQPKDAGRGAIFATVGGCMPVPGVGRSDNENCLAFMRSSFAYAEQNPHITTVIIAALWVSYFYSPGVFQLHLQTQEQIDVATHNEMALAILEKDIRTLVASGKQVYIIGCLPADRRLDPRQLFSRSAGEFRLNTAVTNGVARNELGNIEIINNQLAAMASQSGAIMINPFDYFCTSSRCPLFSSDGQMIYKDANHLTVNYVRNHVPFFDGLY